MDKPEEIEMNQIKNEYEAKILNLKNVLTKAKQAYEQQKALYLEKVFLKKIKIYFILVI